MGRPPLDQGGGLRSTAVFRDGGWEGGLRCVEQNQRQLARDEPGTLGGDRVHGPTRNNYRMRQHTEL